MDKQKRISALQAKVDLLRQEIEQVEQGLESVRPLDSFAPDEKIKVFDELYQQARRYLFSYIETGYPPKDGDHYLYEAVLSEMLGDDVWDIIHALQGWGVKDGGR